MPSSISMSWDRIKGHRSATVTTSVLPEEHEKIVHLAQYQGMSVRDLMRAALGCYIDSWEAIGKESEQVPK